MDRDLFIDWLMGDGGYDSPKSAKDVYSRCCRIERILQKRIAILTSSQEALNGTLERLVIEAPRHMRATANHARGISVLQTAARRAHEYFNRGRNGRRSS